MKHLRRQLVMAAAAMLLFVTPSSLAVACTNAQNELARLDTALRETTANSPARFRIIEERDDLRAEAYLAVASSR